MDKPLFLIVNPRAGLGPRRFEAIASALRKHNLPFHAAMTTQQGDARVLSRLASRGDFRAVVAVGGDGTTNEVVNGFATPDGQISRRAVLGHIPTGTVQDFARGARIPAARKPAVERLANGQEARLDVGRVRFPDGRTHLFVNVLGAGLDAAVAGRAAEVRPILTSIPAHVIGFASALAAYQNTEIGVSLESPDGRRTQFTCRQLVACNGPSYAGVMRVAPPGEEKGRKKR